MLADFIKLITLQCSILSQSNNYDFNMNLNLIFVEVPNFNLGYEGLTWFSEQNSNYQQVHQYYDEYSLNMQSGILEERVIFQNFAKDNIVLYYSPRQYNQSFILQTLEE